MFFKLLCFKLAEFILNSAFQGRFLFLGGFFCCFGFGFGKLVIMLRYLVIQLVPFLGIIVTVHFESALALRPILFLGYFVGLVPVFKVSKRLFKHFRL